MEGPAYPAAVARAGLEMSTPSNGGRVRLDRIIFDELCQRRFTDAARAEFVRVIGGLKAKGCDAVALSCTEIPILAWLKNASEIESMTVIGEIRGKTILLVDDLTETAGTLTTAAALLGKKGAKRILACVSHAILNDVGIERLRKSRIDELITTDTVLRPAIDGVRITTLSVAGLLGEAIKRIHSNSSVTSLFEFKGGRTS